MFTGSNRRLLNTLATTNIEYTRVMPSKQSRELGYSSDNRSQTGKVASQVLPLSVALELFVATLMNVLLTSDLCNLFFPPLAINFPSCLTLIPVSSEASRHFEVTLTKDGTGN